jgi:sugar phosphate isomerase/epimerase
MTGNSLALSPTTLPDTPPLEYVEAASAAGYDAVGLRLHRSPLFAFHPVAGNPSLVRELKRTLAGSGLGVLDILSFYLQPVTNIEAFAAPLELGAFAVIRPLATLGQTLRLLADADRENAVICLDPLNHIRGGGTVAELRAVDPRLLPYAQISDGVLGPGEPNPEELGRMSPNQRRLPGEGTLPLHEILDALPSGTPLSVELPMPKSERRSAREWARTTAESTRRFLDAHARR